MKLHWSPRSPFVRKVMIVLHETGLAERVALVRSPVAMTEVNDVLMADNPLNKIPTLMLDDGTALYDSAVICEYLDSLHQGPRFFPAGGPDRWDALRRQALGDGVLELLVLWRQERIKPAEKCNDTFVQASARKLDAALCCLDEDAPAFSTKPFDIGHVAVGCALSYADYRFADIGWRHGRAALDAWHRGFETRRSAQDTQPGEG